MTRATEVEVADVYRDRVLAGRLARTRNGSEFTYDESFLAADARAGEGIAFRLPPDARRFTTSGVNLHPFFAGLLPEGLRLTALISRTKTSADDLFSLFIAAGADCIGDVSVVPAGEKPRPIAPVLDLARADAADFEELFRRTTSLGNDVLPDVSVPGVQEKVSAAMISFPVGTRTGRGAFILKLNPADRPRLVENEDFFLRMAKDCGLRAASAHLVRDRNGATGLLVQRFDRIFAPAGGDVLKLHQEDACQFLDRYPADKYRLSAREIAEGIAQFAAAPVVETLRFIELYAFSYLIGNGDLHAKNVSLHRSAATGLVELTPAYDLLTTLAYRGLDQRMAIKLDGKDDNFRRKDLRTFGDRHGVRAAAVDDMLDRLVTC